jgi:hypothetical protein
MKYLVLTPYLGSWYPKGTHFEHMGYFDVDGEQASHSTSSVSMGEDEDLYSEENSYTESVGDYFHRIFSKRCGAICRYIWRCSNAQFVPIFQPKS